MMRLAAVVLIAAAAACSRGAAAPADSHAAGELPTLRSLDYAAVMDTLSIDAKTPDHALRSWWRWNDVNDSLMSAERRLPDVAKQRARIAQRLGAILTGDALTQMRTNADRPPERFRREIVEVKPESETRAVVVARVTNITPIPAGATPDAYDTKHRESGDVFRYIFERDSVGWKLSQVQRHNYGDDTTWVPYYTPDKPTVPTWVSP